MNCRYKGSHSLLLCCRKKVLRVIQGGAQSWMTLSIHFWCVADLFIDFDLDNSGTLDAREAVKHAQVDNSKLADMRRAQNLAIKKIEQTPEILKAFSSMGITSVQINAALNYADLVRALSYTYVLHSPLSIGVTLFCSPLLNSYLRLSRRMEMESNTTSLLNASRYKTIARRRKTQCSYQSKWVWLHKRSGNVWIYSFVILVASHLMCNIAVENASSRGASSKGLSGGATSKKSTPVKSRSITWCGCGWKCSASRSRPFRFPGHDDS